MLCIVAIKTPPRKETARAAVEEVSAELLEGSAEGAREEAAAQATQATQTTQAAPATQATKTAQTSHALDKVIERSTLPIATVCFLVFFGYSSLLTFLTPFAETVGLTRAASVFFIVYALSMFATRPFTGRAFDRRGALPVMAPAFVAFIAGMLLMAFASNDWMILGSAALCGYGVGTVQSCGLAMAVNAAPDARLSVANATFYMCLDAGVGIGPLLLGALVPALGYSLLYVVMAGVGVLALVVFLAIRKQY